MSKKAWIRSTLPSWSAFKLWESMLVKKETSFHKRFPYENITKNSPLLPPSHAIGSSCLSKWDVGTSWKSRSTGSKESKGLKKNITGLWRHPEMLATLASSAYIFQQHWTMLWSHLVVFHGNKSKGLKSANKIICLWKIIHS